MAHKCQSVLDEDVLNERGQHVGLAPRERLITPCRLGLSVVASLATQQVQTRADVHRQCNALWERESDENACSTPRRTSTSPAFFRTSLGHIMRQLTMKVLGFEAGQAFSAFNRLLLQDGSAFALHEALAAVFPGRCNAVSPAAVARHGTLEVLQDAPITMALRPDTDAEHDSRPEPQSLRGDVCLADRGSLDLASVRDIDRHGGCCMVRSKAGLHPRVIDASREDGQRLTSCQDRDCQAIIAQCPTRQRAELDVAWLIEGEPFRVRRLVRWHPATTCVDSLLTNRHQDRYTIKRICRGYQLRWHVELLLKEWKSYTNLHQFDTEKDTISEVSGCKFCKYS